MILMGKGFLGVSVVICALAFLELSEFSDSISLHKGNIKLEGCLAIGSRVLKNTERKQAMH